MGWYQDSFRPTPGESAAVRRQLAQECATPFSVRRGGLCWPPRLLFDVTPPDETISLLRPGLAPGRPSNPRGRTMVISPTVGRVVWFRQMTPGVFPGSDGVCAALVAKVWHDRLVNLCVIDENGNTHSRTSVVLVQEGDEAPTHQHCAWMPYQLSKAKAGDPNSESAEPRPR